MTAPFNIQTSPITTGTTLVEAGAGTGKTYALTRMVLRLLLEGAGEGPIELPHILVVTFTRAATSELVTRIRQLISEAERVFAGAGTTDDELINHLKANDKDGKGLGRLREALRQCDELAVCTIHSFCQRVLTSNAFESGMPFHTENVEDDDTRYIDLATIDFWRDRVAADELLAALSVSRGWKREQLVEHFKKWRRHPHTELLPESRPVVESLADFSEAVAKVLASFDTTALTAFAEDTKWNKDVAMAPESLHEVIGGLEALGRGDLITGLETALACTTDNVHDKMSKRVKAQKEPPDFPLFQACDRLAKAVDDVLLCLSREFIETVGRTFDLEKRKRHILAFDDMLRRLDEALNRPGDAGKAEELRGSIGKQYEAALIDEFQDTDPFQYAIFRTAFAGKPLFLIGDPKQAIYRFRGADIFTYLEAKRNAGKAYSLTKNWRSESGLVNAVNRVFARCPGPFVHPEIPFEDAVSAEKADEKPLAGDDTRPLTWMVLTRGETKKPPAKEAAREIIYKEVVREVVRLLGDQRLTIGGRRVGPPDIAILVRDNWQASDLQGRLRDAGVPAIIANTESVLQTREMAELETVMTAVLNTRYHAAVRGALTTELWGEDASRIRTLDESDTLWEEAVEELEHLRDTWLACGFTAMAQRLIARQNVRARLAALVDGERRLTNLLHCVEILHQAAARDSLAPDGLLSWVRRTRSEGTSEREATELRLESEADAVTISTIHRAKGLQYGIVFCTDLWDSKPKDKKQPLLVHHREDESRVVYAFGEQEREAYLPRAEAERLAEELRLAYVALTRAIHRCYVVWGDIGQTSGGSWKSALRYLLRPVEDEDEQPPDMEDAPGLITGDAAETIESLVLEHPSLMQRVELVETDGPLPVWQKEQPGEAPEFSARALKHNLTPRFDIWKVTSFSALTKDQGHQAYATDVILIHDSEGAVFPDETPDHKDPATDLVVIEETEPKGIFAFAKGARSGNCFHGIFEHCDFTSANDSGTGALVEWMLKSYDLLDPARHYGELNPHKDVWEMVKRVTSATLPVSSTVPDAVFSLDQVDMEHRLNEWEFYLPFEKLKPADLGDLFAAHAEGPIAVEYADHLRRLDEKQVHGYLKGYVDLVFQHNNRWYIIDWKSNHLGNSPGDYNQDALWRPMVDHHYILQYHLYCAALHQFLKVRQDGYDYDKHFGGVYYAFLRGIDGSGDTGWYHDRPPRTLVEALL